MEPIWCRVEAHQPGLPTSLVPGAQFRGFSQREKGNHVIYHPNQGNLVGGKVSLGQQGRNSDCPGPLPESQAGQDSVLRLVTNHGGHCGSLCSQMRGSEGGLSSEQELEPHCL